MPTTNEIIDQLNGFAETHPNEDIWNFILASDWYDGEATIKEFGADGDGRDLVTVDGAHIAYTHGDKSRGHTDPAGWYAA